jgi:hypothetical protein
MGKEGPNIGELRLKNRAKKETNNWRNENKELGREMTKCWRNEDEEL